MTYDPNYYKPNFLKTLMFVFLGLAMIIAADLFIVSGKQFILPERLFNAPEENLVDVASLRQQHNQYLEEGVIPYEDAPLAGAIPQVDRVELITARAQNTTDRPEDLLSVDDIIEREKEQKLAAVETAAGAPEADVTNTAYYAPKPEYESFEDNLAEAPDNTVTETPEINEDITYISPKGKGQVAIIIDDMGVSLRSKLVEVMDGPLTLAYLPYADDLKARTKRAKNNGHEIMVHMPMEPMNGSLDGGPRVLKTSQGKEELLNTLNWGLSQFDGYVGVNNHMGSRMTQDEAGMRIIMKDLKKRGVYFIDSKTINSSVAADIAREEGVPYAVRDVFLDHEMTEDFVREALRKLERTAKANGHAIAIGHPHKVTVDVLKEWLPTLEEKGLTLVPASALINRPQELTSQNSPNTL